ncbi:MAG: PKD domain-containing protein, partial [Vicingus serpentipes]|nr:PKD domain-containing protein [Vicingus serpentipes]
NLDDPTIANPTFTPTVDGVFTYVVTITDDLGTDTDSTTITVNPLPVVIASLDTSICVGASANVMASGASTYVWDNGLPATAGPHNVSPITTTTYTVTGTDVNGCVNDSSVTVTVNPLPVPDAGVDQAICIGDNATVTATSTGAAPITYTWDQNPPGTGAGPHSLSPTISTTYTVTATDNNGCVNTDAMTITVNPLPVPDAGVDQTICIGNNATITATSNGTNPIGYTWDNGLTATAGPHNVNPAATTIYTVTATDNNGCMNTDVVTVTVNPLPTPNAGTDQTICLNGNATITAISGGTGPFNFIWDNGLPATNGPHTVSPAVGTTTYIVTVTDANGCVNTDSVDITVNPIPTIVASNDTNICAGESATLFASGGSTYVWKNLTTGVDFSTSSNPTVQPTDANTCYQTTSNDAAGCVSTDVVCVTVEQPPVTDFNVNEVCNGETTLFNNLTTGAAAYTWDFGDGNISNVFNPQHTYNGEGKYYVQLTATSQAGCMSFDADTAIVKYVPVVNFDGINLTGCSPVMATFTNRSDSLDPTFTYLWEFGDATSSNISDTNVSHTYAEVGSYTVRLTVTSNGCSNMRERINYVIVHPAPQAHFTAEPGIVDIYEPTINFTDLSIGADFWFWNFGDATTSNDQHPIHLYTDTGVFTVWLRVENQYGCADSISKPVEIKDVYTFFAPNAFTPDGDGVNDVFLPQGHAIDLNEYKLYIFNRWGELIFETHHYDEGWDGTVNGVLVQTDTYVWRVELQDIFGKNHQYIGRVSVMK